MTDRATEAIIADIVQNWLQLANSRVFVYNQNFKIPKDSGLYVVVQRNSSKPYGAVNKFNSTTNQEEITVTLLEDFSVHIFSRDDEATDKKEKLYLAFNSNYSKELQGKYQFKLSWFGQRLVNVSGLEGGAILNRYVVDISAYRSYKETRSTDYYDDFRPTEIYNDIP